MAQTVYVVDDNQSALQRNVLTLNEAGLKVIGYNTKPLEALAELESLEPDIICLDIIMPEMDGIEMYRKLSRSKPGSRIIFVTAMAMEHKFIGHFAESIGADRFLPKPLTIDNLRQALALPKAKPVQEALLSGHQPEAPLAEAPPVPAGAQQAEPESEQKPPAAPSAASQPRLSAEEEPQPSKEPASRLSEDREGGQGEHINPFGRDPKLL